MKISMSHSLGLRGIVIVIAAMVSMTLLSACSEGGDSEAIAGVMENVSQQSAQIEALWTQVGNLQSELSEAQKMEVADLRAGIEDLRERDNMSVQFDDSALKSEIGELHDAISKIEGRISSIDDEGMDTDALGKKLAALSDAVADLQERMDSVDEGDDRIDSEHIESLNAELSSVLKALSDLQGSGAGSQTEEVIARLDWLENAVAPAYTRAYVEEAILRYNREGREATLDYYNTMESVNGDLYLFVLDENYEIIAHPTVPANIGMDIRGPLGTDITGKNYGAEFVTVDGQGKWIDYVYLNPAANFTFERKHAWIVRHDNLIFGSGWYERTVSFQSTPGDYVRALVGQAIARYDAIGKDTILSYYNSPASVHGPYYVFVVDSSDLSSVADGARPDLVGTIPDRIDPTGYNYTNDLASATTDGGWISYVILNPDTGEQQRKHSWISLHDGLIFGSGWYESGAISASKDNPAAYTRAFVQQAIARYDSLGRDATLEYYQDPASVDGQWYIFVVEDGINIGSATRPDLIGTSTRDRKDITGKPYGRDIAEATEEGRWVDYVFLNPQTGEQQQKHSWVQLHDGLVFGSGWYESVESLKADNPEAFTLAYVARALQHYDDNGLDATLGYYNSQDSVDGQWYVFVADASDFVLVHPINPDLIGTDINDIVGSNGYELGKEIAKATEEGHWVEYPWPNPVTDMEEPKRSWVIRHDGLIFGSGYYTE